MKEYYNKPEETEKTYVNIKGKVYCRMGDFVCCQPDGELVYMKRLLMLLNIRSIGYLLQR